MSDNAAYRELVGVLDRAIQAGANSIGFEWRDRDLMVFHQAGPLGLGADRIPEGMEQAVIEELVERAGLNRKPSGKMPVTLSGRDFEVVVEEYDSFGNSAYQLTIKERRK